MPKLYQPPTTSTLALLFSIILITVCPTTTTATTCTPCGLLIRPAGFYGISSTSTRTTTSLGPFPPDNNYSFKLSQTGNGKAIQGENDLIATYTNVPCTTTSTQTLEFFFEPISDYSYSGNTKIDVYNINGNLPRNGATPAPTWENLNGKTGGLVGSFTMPNSEASQVRTNFAVGKVPCKSELNLRLSITNTNFLSGSVDYTQDYAGYVDGLKVKAGC